MSTRRKSEGFESTAKSQLHGNATYRWARAARTIWAMTREDIYQLDNASHREAEEKSRERRLRDDQVLAKLERLAQVRSNGTDAARLRAGVCYGLNLAWVDYSRPRPRSKKGEHKRALIQLSRLARFSSNLRKSFDDLNDAARTAIMYASAEIEDRTEGDFYQNGVRRPPRPPEESIDFEPYKKMIERIDELFLEADQWARRSPRARPRGRPAKGSLAFSFHLFTLELLWDVRAAGGRLTLDKNMATGTLLEALRLLRPYLPPGFVPIALPLSTLAGLKALDKKIGLASLVEDLYPSLPK
jgi:hypothetical protein